MKCINIRVYADFEFVDRQAGAADMRNQLKIKVITHTGSDMPLEEAKRLSIDMVADIVMFGDDVYRNMVDIHAEEFYKKLDQMEKLPTSSQPSPGDFIEAFRKAADGADEILCLMITSKMSGCYTSAIVAKQILEKEGFPVPIYVYDTKQCSHGMAQMVRAAADMANKGYTSGEIINELDLLQSKMGVYLVLESLKNARKGGRVGAIKMLAADLLGIKPLLVFSDGLVKDIGIARSFQDGIDKVLDKLYEEGDFSLPITVFHAAAPERAENVAKQILEKHEEAQIRIEFVGPVIGIYTGTGCCGISFTKL